MRRLLSRAAATMKPRARMISYCIALSSRNALLSPEERTRALALAYALRTRDRDEALAVLRGTKGLAVDYVEVALFDPPVLAGAIRVGSTRLIDNVVLAEGPDPGPGPGPDPGPGPSTREKE